MAKRRGTPPFATVWRNAYNIWTGQVRFCLPHVSNFLDRIKKTATTEVVSNEIGYFYFILLVQTTTSST